MQVLPVFFFLAFVIIKKKNLWQEFKLSQDIYCVFWPWLLVALMVCIEIRHKKVSFYYCEHILAHTCLHISFFGVIEIKPWNLNPSGSASRIVGLHAYSNVPDHGFALYYFLTEGQILFFLIYASYIITLEH